MSRRNHRRSRFAQPFHAVLPSKAMITFKLKKDTVLQINGDVAYFPNVDATYRIDRFNSQLYDAINGFCCPHFRSYRVVYKNSEFIIEDCLLPSMLKYFLNDHDPYMTFERQIIEHFRDKEPVRRATETSPVETFKFHEADW